MDPKVSRFFGGVPTAPDVRRLMEHFGELPRNGKVLRHEEIATVINEDIKSNRYKTILQSWRKKLRREFGTVLDGRKAPGIGLRVLTDLEMIEYGVQKSSLSCRQLKDGFLAVAQVDEAALDADGISRRRGVQAELQSLLEQHLVTTKTIHAVFNKPQLKPPVQQP